MIRISLRGGQPQNYSLIFPINMTPKFILTTEGNINEEQGEDNR